MAPRLRIESAPEYQGATRVVLSIKVNDDIHYAAVIVDLDGMYPGLAEEALLDAVAQVEHQLGVEV